LFRSKQSSSNRIKSRLFGKLAITAAILGLISVPLIPIIYVVGMISIIGIPLALAAIFFPTVCLIVVLAYCLWRFVFNRFLFGIAASFIGALVILAFIPLAHNLMVKRSIHGLQTGDVARPVKPLIRDETLVVFKHKAQSNYCDEVCLELLLDRRVKAYAVGRLLVGRSMPDREAPVLLHYLSKSPNCGKRLISLRSEKWKKTQAGSVAHVLSTAEKSGACVNSVEVPIDRLVSPRFFAIMDQKSLKYRDKALFIETQIKPWRVAVFDRGPDGSFLTAFQDTAVGYSLLQPLLAYHLTMGSISNVRPKWWRKDVRVERPDDATLLADILGVRLRYQ